MQGGIKWGKNALIIDGKEIELSGEFGLLYRNTGIKQ